MRAPGYARKRAGGGGQRLIDTAQVAALSGGATSSTFIAANNVMNQFNRWSERRSQHNSGVNDRPVDETSVRDYDPEGNGEVPSQSTLDAIERNWHGDEESATVTEEDWDREVEGERDLIGDLEVIDGRIGGKVPVEEYKPLRVSSVKNADSNVLTLGSYTGDDSSYIARAGDTSYFDMGSDWDKVQEQYDLSSSEMFNYFNKPVLNDALYNGKEIRFSHNPIDGGGFLRIEWEYIKSMTDLVDSDLIFEGGFWHVG